MLTLTLIIPLQTVSILTNATTGEICFVPHTPSIAYYTISIFDNTGDLTYQHNNISNESCIYTSAFEEYFCAPFQVLVDVHHLQQTSHTINYTVPKGESDQYQMKKSLILINSLQVVLTIVHLLWDHASVQNEKVRLWFTAMYQN